ncbi:MAG: uroporphyrinogen decarboxylase family protein [Thermoproteota archaeon]
MDKVERVYTALRIHEPDKVPKGELQIHDELVAALLKEPLKDHFEAHVRVRKILHIDLINLGLEGGPPVELIGDTQEGYPVYRDWVGNEWVESGRTRRFLKHALDTAEKMNEFEAPNIDLFHASSVKRWVEHTDFCVFAQIGGVFDSVYPLMGLETYVKALYTCPEALRNVIEEVYRFDLKAIGLLAEAGAHVILVGDDLAYDSGPFLSLASLRKYVLPYLRGGGSGG